MKISVIVPIYNVEKYLERCLDSLQRQSYNDLEILLVDDGSTDTSLEICNRFAQTDPKFKVFHKENGGLSSARNFGIDQATGEYLCFIDSDDWVSQDYCRMLLQACIDHKALMSFCDLKRVKVQQEEEEKKEPVEKVLSKEEALHFLDRREAPEYVTMTISCNKLYHRSLFAQLRYPEGRLHEDEYLMGDLLLQVEQVVYVACVLYYYYQREDSITGKKTPQEKGRLDILFAYQHRCEIFLKKEKVDFFYVAWRNYILTLLEFMVADSLAWKDIKKHILFTYYKEGLVKYHRQLPIKYKLKYGLFYIWPRLYSRLFPIRAV